MSGPLKLTDLPNEVLQQVLSYLTYDEIAKNRMVCCKFNQTCEQLLNRGFITMERRHSEILKKVKALLPRRESERRVHQLARHSDILTAIETRISMLRMTFMKYVEMNYCCFIPGKVIDEILRILEIVQETCTPPRTHEVLQELRDISSMAMEHFDEKIAPQFKMLRCVPTFLPSPVLAPMPELLIRRDTFRKDMKIVKRRSLLHKQQIFVLKNVVSKLVAKVRRQNTTIHSQTMRLREQSSKLKEQDTCIAELKRHVEEWDLKFADLVAELTRARDETTSSPNKTSTSSSKFADFISELNRHDESSKKPNTTISCTPKTTSEFDTSLSSPYNTHSTTPRLFKSNIKPRAQILPKSLSIMDLPNFELERKRKMPSLSHNIPSKISRLQYQLRKNEKEVNELSLLHDKFTADLEAIPNFLSSSLKSILNSPISSIKSRKRKLQ